MFYTCSGLGPVANVFELVVSPEMAEIRLKRNLTAYLGRVENHRPSREGLED